jgi:hypothetical protein
MVHQQRRSDRLLGAAATGLVQMQAEPTLPAIDAAWTPTQPIGMTFVRQRAGRWQCLASAPGFPEF